MNASEVIAENGFDLWSDTERDIFRHMQELIVVIHNRLDEARQTLLRQLD